MPAERICYVLDSYALLAYLEEETGCQQVKEILAQALRREVDVVMCIVNYGEVLYITEREQGLSAARKAIAAIDQLPIVIFDDNRGLTFSAAQFKARYPLSCADAFVVALAQAHHARVLTGDLEFESVAGLVAVDWLPAHD
jgi:predicted nucleic acid-binding protein